jgi:hypothetical protein
MRLSLKFKDARFVRSSPRDKFDLLLGVVATFEIMVGERILYHEEEFPIVELRVQLVRWIDDGFISGVDFTLDSMESDEPGMVWFRKDAEGGWRAGSLFQEYIEVAVWSNSDVLNSVTRFVTEVDDWVDANLGVRVAEVVNR